MTDDFLERLERSHKNWTGGEWSAEAVLDHFMLYSPAKRIEAIEQVEAECRAADTSNLRRYSELASLRRAMNSQHQAGLKVGK